MDIQRPRGTRDFLFNEMNRRKFVENTFKRIFENYGYQEIKTPLFEDLSLFTMKSGEGITEQIYHFQDKSGRELALRPELTAPVARLYLNELKKAPKPLKMYYFGSCFRYERPQKGRWRQFWQFGCELIGGKSPESEAEVIALSAHCLEELGLKEFDIHVGNLGILRGILDGAGVPGEDQDQIMNIIDKGDVNELKSVLEDLKVESGTQDVLLKMVRMKGPADVLKKVQKIMPPNPSASQSLKKLEELLTILEAFNCTNYIVDLGIARGLDYYSGMVFEIYVHGLGAQKQISGGGTYNLIELFGGETVESTGFAFGFDRVMDALESQNIKKSEPNTLEVFVAPITDEVKLEAFDVAQKLRKKGVKTDVDLVGRKLKKNLSQAHSLGVKYVVLVGKKELKEGKITLKDMRSGEQIYVGTDQDLVEFLS